MPVLDGLAGVVDSLGVPGGIVILRRTGATRDVDGNPAVGRHTRMRVCPAILQAATGRDLLRLPEGDRTSETKIIHTKERLRTAEEATENEADVLLHREPGETDDSRYTIVKSSDWNVVAGFYRFLAMREERG